MYHETIIKKIHMLGQKGHAQWMLGHSKYLKNHHSNNGHSKNSSYYQNVVFPLLISSYFISFHFTISFKNHSKLEKEIDGNNNTPFTHFCWFFYLKMVSTKHR